MSGAPQQTIAALAFRKSATPLLALRKHSATLMFAGATVTAAISGVPAIARDFPVNEPLGTAQDHPYIVETASPNSTEDAELAKDIAIRFTNTWVHKVSPEQLQHEIDRVSLVRVDLNDDGHPDVLFHVGGACGTHGCLLEGGLRLAAKWRYLKFCDVAQLVDGIQVLPSRTNGLHDLRVGGRVFSYSSGIYCPRERKQ